LIIVIVFRSDFLPLIYREQAAFTRNGYLECQIFEEQTSVLR